MNELDIDDKKQPGYEESDEEGYFPAGKIMIAGIIGWVVILLAAYLAFQVVTKIIGLLHG